MPSEMARDSMFADGAGKIGPLESRHMASPLYRNATESERVTPTHWHIAWANGLGWASTGWTAPSSRWSRRARYLRESAD